MSDIARPQRLPAAALVAIAAVAAALAACTEPNDEARLIQIWRQADRACASGDDRIPAGQIFQIETQLCYAYETVQDRPVPLVLPHWTDNDRIRGEDRRGHRTFDIAATSIRSASGAVVQFYDTDFACIPIGDLVAVRDTRSERIHNAPCAWLVGTAPQIERYEHLGQQ